MSSHRCDVDGKVRPILASWEEEAWSAVVAEAITNIAAERRIPIEVVAHGPEAARIYKTTGAHPAVLLRPKHIRPRT